MNGHLNKMKSMMDVFDDDEDDEKDNLPQPPSPVSATHLSQPHRGHGGSSAAAAASGADNPYKDVQISARGILQNEIGLLEAENKQRKQQIVLAAPGKIRLDHKGEVMFHKPRTLALYHHILVPLDEKMSVRSLLELDGLLSWDADLEWELVQRLTTNRYRISYALMWLETTTADNPVKINLAGILKCPERCAQFVEICDVLCAKQLNYANKIDNRNEQLHRLKAQLLKLFTRDPSPFTDLELVGMPITPVPPPVPYLDPHEANIRILLGMVKSASHNPYITLASVKAVVHSQFKESEMALAFTTMHSFAKMAKFIATHYVMHYTHRGDREVAIARRSTEQWLRAFFMTGCSCDR
jgi:hypothetical protein